ncbi:MAG: OmpH family outer membrane protein [Flavobacteriales bacterium]|nr:OmpH family outer membrane protein [Flavobacteriales bacterium]
MSNRPLLLLLVFWNLLLTGAIIWSLTRARVPDRILKEKLSNIAAGDTLSDGTVADTARMAEGNIAFFFMDSVQSQFELVKESTDRVRSEGKRMENALQREMDKAQGRYQTLMSKDHTYSTQAELGKDQAELEQLGQKFRRCVPTRRTSLTKCKRRCWKTLQGRLRIS